MQTPPDPTPPPPVPAPAGSTPPAPAGFDVPGGRGPRFKDRTRSYHSTLGRQLSTLVVFALLAAVGASTVWLGKEQWAVRGYMRSDEPAGIVQTQVVPVSHRTLGRVFETRIRTTYRLGDDEYVSNSHSAKVLYWFTRRHAMQIAARYPEGGITTIFYNKDKPELAVIEKRLLVEHAPTMLLLPPLLMLALGRLAGPLVGWLRTSSDPSRTGVRIDTIEEDAGVQTMRVRMPSEDSVRYGRRLSVAAASLSMLACAAASFAFPATVSLLAVIAICIACGALGVAAAMRRAKAQLAKGRTIVLNPANRTMVVKGRGRDNRDANLTLHAHEIEAVVIEDTWRHAWRWDQKLGRKNKALVQDNSTVTIRLRSGGVIPIAIWHHPRNAPEFGKWLCGALAAIERGELPGTRRETVQEDKDDGRSG